MPKDQSPKAYTGRVLGKTNRVGQVEFDSTDFSVDDFGKVSLGGTGNVENLTPDSGSVTPAAGLLTLAGGEGIDTSGSGSTITIAGEDASTSNKGVASFAAADFSVSSGAVSLNEAIPQYATVSITAAQVKALAATQIELVAAPGAGKMIKFMGASLKLVYGSEVFTEAGDNLGIKYTDDTGYQVSNTIEMTGFIDQSADTYTNAEPATDAIVAASAAENAPLVLDNLGSEIAGNASDDSTLEVSVCYRITEI